jgi:hypothetical protein
MIGSAVGGVFPETKGDSAVSVAADNPEVIPAGCSHNGAGSADDDFYFRSYHWFLFSGLSTFPVSTP